MAQLYRVKLDGTDIHRIGNQSMTLLEPELTLEVGTAGTLTFLLPPGHVFYNNVQLLTSTIEVLEENTPIWSGRPTEVSTDFLGRRKVYAEGALAYLNDSVQGAGEYNSISIRTFFRNLIATHNAAVPASRRFTVGDVTVTDRNVYRKLEYEQTYEAIRTMCLDTRGGYLMVRREGGVNYLDWLRSLPGNGDQPVQYGYNLLDLTQQTNGGEIVTRVLPLGDEDDSGNLLTVASVNGGSKIVSDANLVAQYGNITKTVQFSGITSAADLLAEAQDWLSDNQPEKLTIEVDAADLHYINEEYAPLRVGQRVRVRSEPHGINRVLPITKLVIALDSAQKKVTLGTLPRRTLSEIVKENRDKKSRDSNSGSNSGSGGSGYSAPGADSWRHWVGTAAEYAALYPHYNAQTVYFVTTGDADGQVSDYREL